MRCDRLHTSSVPLDLSSCPAPANRFHSIACAADFVCSELHSARTRARTVVLGGPAVTRVLDHLGATRGLPRILRTDDGPGFCGRVMLPWAHERQVTLRLIEPGKPTQNACIESFNGRFRDECLNEHWFTSVAHADVVIEAWRREYNEKRPK